MTSLSYWERKFEEFRNSHTLEVASLDYLDLANSEKVSQKDLAYNLKILAYREDLGNKVTLAAVHACQKLTVQELREDNRKLQADLRACKKEIARLKASQDIIQKEVLKLASRRPLTKRDVEELVIKISEQPKFIEQQTEALTVELSRKVDKVEKLIHKLEHVIRGE